MIIERILTQLAPHECIGCKAEGRLLCSGCLSELPGLPERCYRCRKATASGKTCSNCRNHTGLFSIRARSAYTGHAKELVWQLKFSNARAAASEMAAEIAPLLPSSADVVIVPVPTATSRARRRGYDQSYLIAKALARQTEALYSPSLRRLGQHHQVGSTRTQRLEQLKTAYRVVRPRLVQDAHIVLVDDVLTTGATLEAAAAVLLASGAKRVSGLVFAQA